MAASQNLEHSSMKPRCHAFEEGARSPKSDGDFFLQKTTQDSNTKISVVDYGLLEIMNSEGSRENRKMTVSSQKNTTDYNEAHKRSSPEIGEWTDQIPSIYNIQTDPNHDCHMDSNLTRGQNELGNSELIRISAGFQECHLENQSVKKLNYLVNKILWTSGQNTSSNLKISQKENTSNNGSDSHESKEILSVSVDDDILKVPSLSISAEKILQSKCDVCGKIFECLSDLEDHYLDHEYYHSKLCRICKDYIYKHVGKGDCRENFKCCYQECTYEINYLPSFKRHLYTHSIFRLFKCELCGKRYKTQGSLSRHSQTHAKCV